MTFVRPVPALIASLILTACGVADPSTGADTSDTWVTNDDALNTHGMYETFVARDGRYHFHLLAGNGERVLSSQGYATQAASLNGIESVKDNGTDASKYLLREASDGSWYFVLPAANGELIASSEMYSSESNAKQAMSSVAAVVQSTTNQGAAITGAAKFEVFKGLDSKYHFDVRALNGEIVLQSQSYTSRTSALNGALSVQTNGSTPTRYLVLAAADGRFYFLLKASNGATIARSQLYATKYGAERGVADCVDLLKSDLPR